ncbi:MAG: amino acid adenylation domain-containing protein [Chloroflexi bacterium]|nr:amino acid adenylation domain-containing protein [Chloroflexota bacterium]
MTTAAFLAHLRQLDVDLRVEGDQLRCRAPRDVLTPALRAELAERKAEILAFLSQAQEVTPAQPPYPRQPEGNKPDATPDAASPASDQVARPQTLPLLEGQQHFWLFAQMGEGAGIASTIPLILRLKGPLRVAALRQALQQIIDRHEALRVTFDGHGEFQTVWPTMTLDVPLTDFSHLDPATREAQVSQWLDGYHRELFDLIRGPLVRAHILKLAEEDHIFVFIMSHVISDGWSLGLVIEELGLIYTAICQGTAAKLPKPMPFAEYVRWEVSQRQSASRLASEAFWLQQFAGGVPVLNLPADRPRPMVMSLAGGEEHIWLDASLLAALKRVSRRYNTTLYTLFLGAYTVFLHRLSGQNDIVVGSPSATVARSLPGTERMVGFLLNVMPANIRVASEAKFSEHLSSIKQAVLDIYEHSDCPYGTLIQKLNLSGDLSQLPLFTVTFNVDRQIELSQMGGLTVELMDPRISHIPFDLDLNAIEVNGQMQVHFLYNSDLFDRETIRRWLEHFKTLLEAIAADPTRRISDLPLLTESERQQLLVTWNATESTYPIERCVHELIEAQVEQWPNAAAVVFKEESLTYRELNQRANQLGHYLQKLGVGPETLVAICMERSLAMVVGLLGILKAGGAYIPLDPAYPAERLAFMLEDTQAPVLLTQRHLVEQWQLSQGPLPITNNQFPVTICLDSDWQKVAQHSKSNPVSGAGAENLAYVIYTSGSTGRPKGVEIEHGGLLNLIFWHQRAYELSPQTQTTQLAGTGFDASVWEIWPSLAAGACLYLPDEETRLTPSKLRDWLVAMGITISFLPTPLAEALLTLNWPQGAALRTLLTGGDKLHHYPSRPSGFTLVNHYGPTENTVVSTATSVPVKPELEIAPPIGRPISNTQIYLLDRVLQPVPVGVPGELYVDGDGLARSYLNRPGMTAEKFVPNPFSKQPGRRFYKTGDLARYMPDGHVEFLGRMDKQIKIRGFRVELGEIETVLSQHPALQEVAVIVRAEAAGGVGPAGSQFLIAYVVPYQDHTPSIDELRSFLRAKLPEYMVPSTFMLLDVLPLTPNGKVDREALPMPEGGRPEQEAVYMPPRTGAERTIATIWQELLQVDQVGIYDNFFDLGGYSLLIVQMQSSLREAFNKEIPLLELFKNPTISALARYLNPLPTERVASEHLAHKQVPAPKEAQKQRLGPKEGTGSEIAIIGMVGRFPRAKNLDEFWQNLRNGVECITFFSDEELLTAGVSLAELRNPNYVKAMGVLADIELFDAAFFGFSPREAELMDPQQRIFLECAWEALANAGYDSETYGGRIGVYAGASAFAYLFNNLYSNLHLMDSLGIHQFGIGNLSDFLTTRVSYKLNLKGPSIDVQTACSTSLVAIHLACQSLLNDECDIALAGGISIGLPQEAGYWHEEGSILSPDGHCRAFDARARGFVSGSGVGIVTLKRLADALADGDTIHAVIKGSAINNDGREKVGYTAPSVEGQAAVITKALDVAGVEPDTITYVEAHGTGTVVGDPIEIAALTRAFRPRTRRQTFCAIGSVKTNVGHLDAAAGVAGLIKIVLAFKHKSLPPSLHFEKPNPKIDFANSPFYVNAQLREWVATETPRRAGVSSFGVGGTNAHAVLEEAPPVMTSGPSRPWHLLVLSAKTAKVLETMTTQFIAYCLQHPDANLADVAYTLQVGRPTLSYRRMLVCRDLEEAVNALEARDPKRVFSSLQESRERPVVFMFPGQGAQYVGMGAELYELEPVFREWVDRCAELLTPHLGLDLRAVLYPPEDKAEEAQHRLEQTALAQAALFVIEYALAQLWLGWGVQPRAMIGHSIGEYVAACLAGVFSLEEALALVASRGRLMQSLPGGAMLAVSLPERDVLPLLNENLSIAAVNGPTLCVISGSREVVGALDAQLTSEAVECRRLHTSHAFHSAMMDPIIEPFMVYMSGVRLQPPQIPYVSNVTGAWITAAEATEPGYWARHLRQPVRFAAGVQTLLAEPGCILLEVGPGQTLATLASQQLDKAAGQVVLSSSRHPRKQESDMAFLLNTAGRLWLAGASVQWSGLYTHERRCRLPLPTYPFERQRYWVEPSTQVSTVRQAQTDDGRLASDGAEDSSYSHRARVDLLTAYAAPVTETEQRIATIWQETLGFEQVGLHDDLFVELGGHSLMAVKLVSRLRDAFQVELPVESLFEAPTVAELAQVIDDLCCQDGGGAAVTTAVDLEAEAVLDPVIAPAVELERIFLTGATGFLGSFILRELLHQTNANIYCLVRATTVEEGNQRIQTHLETNLLWDDSLASRIIPVPGDLSKPFLGLAEDRFQKLASTVDVIYHSGGMVNFIYPYAAHKAINVRGTQEVLRLASEIRLKPVHFISTVAFLSSPDHVVIREDDNIDDYREGLEGGYPQSKWVAEKLVTLARSRGIPVCIYRPGEIAGHSKTGVWTDDFIFRLITSCVQLGMIPDVNPYLEMIPVDYVSQAVVHLSRQEESLGKVFHLTNPNSFSLSEIAEWFRSVGCPLQRVPYSEWRANLVSSGENALLPFLSLFPRPDPEEQMALGDILAGNRRFDYQNTLNGLAGTSIICPPVDANLLRTYFSNLIRSRYQLQQVERGLSGTD